MTSELMAALGRASRIASGHCTTALAPLCVASFGATYLARAAHQSARVLPQRCPWEFSYRQLWRRFARLARAGRREQLLRSRDVPVSLSYASRVPLVGDHPTPNWPRWMLAATPSNDRFP